jgi:hypothetical protein
MSPRWNRDSPIPSRASECAPPPEPKGGGAHSPAGEVRGWGSPNSNDCAYFTVVGTGTIIHLPR